SGDRRSLPLGPLAQGLDVLPELPPFGAFGLWKLGEGGGVADTGEVGVLLPVPHHLLDSCAVFRLAAIQTFVPGGEVGAQPPEGPGAELGTLLLREFFAFDILPTGDEGRATGGVVAEI